MPTNEASEPVVVLRSVVKSYGEGDALAHALRGIDLSLPRGSFAACAGPSGSGKTTLLNLVGCLDRPTSGEILIEGRPVHDLGRDELAALREARLGFVFQTFNLIPVLSAFENVELPLLLRPGSTREARRAAVQTMLDEVGLGALAHRRPSELSGGQQQRVAVARALVKQPALVLADEPTANLDSATGRGLLELMAELNRRHGTTFLFSTHDGMVMDFARRLVRIHDGRITGDETRDGAPCS